MDKWLNHPCVLYHPFIDIGSGFLVQMWHIFSSPHYCRLACCESGIQKVPFSKMFVIVNNKVLSMMKRKELEILCICIYIIFDNWTYINYAITKPTTASGSFKKSATLGTS
jgi:hypothetical protein